MGIIWILLGVVLLGFYNGLLLLDDKTPEDDPKNKEIQNKWHFVGASIFLYLGATAWYVWGIQYIPFTLASFWMIFGGIVHRIGLNKPFFYVGTTAKTDILLRKVFSKDPELGSEILKTIAMVLSIALIIICK